MSFPNSRDRRFRTQDLNTLPYKTLGRWPWSTDVARIPKPAPISALVQRGNPNTAVVPKSRLDVVPAAQYVIAEQSAKLYKTLYEATLPTRRAPVPVTWDSDVSELIESVVAEANQDDCFACSSVAINYAKEILFVCSDLYVSEPSLTHDDEGGIEVFLKENEKAVLFKVEADGTLGVFGDSPNGQWRAKYSSGVEDWKRHLNAYIEGIVQ